MNCPDVSCGLSLQYSLCNDPLIELSNPGASGSIFYVTSDDEFIIKTVQHKEAEFLQKLLPGYFMVSSILVEHCAENTKAISLMTIFLFFSRPRIWIKTRERCCPSFMAFTACSRVVRTSVSWWWTTSCPAACLCTSSTTWRAPRTSDGLLLKRERRESPLAKTLISSRTCQRESNLNQTTTTPSARPSRGTVWWASEVLELSCSVSHQILWL